MIEATHYLIDLGRKIVPVSERARVPQSGYGRRIPTHQMVKLPGQRRWRRVYCCIYSNAGTYYVESRNRDPETGRPNWIVIC